MSGPQRLGALLRHWRPAEGPAGTRLNRDAALAQLISAWPEAVGGDVAARSRPLRLIAGTLTILTASSAWSDELSLLAPGILQALRARCPESGVNQLRFRVASGRSRLLFERRARHNRRSDSATLESEAASRSLPEQRERERPSESAEDIGAIVARLRARQAAFDADRDREGWAICGGCERRFPAGDLRRGLCAPCSAARARRRDAGIERVLMQAPWLRDAQVAAEIRGVDAREVAAVRRRLTTRWQRELDEAQRRLRRSAVTAQDRVVAWSYIMLLSHLPQRDIGRAVVVDVLGRDWASALLEQGKTAKREAARPSQPNHP